MMAMKCHIDFDAMSRCCIDVNVIQTHDGYKMSHWLWCNVKMLHWCYCDTDTWWLWNVTLTSMQCHAFALTWMWCINIKCKLENLCGYPRWSYGINCFSNYDPKPVLEWHNDSAASLIYHCINPFTPEFLKWAHPSLSLNTSIVTNRGLVKSVMEWQKCRSWWDSSLWALLSASTLFANIMKTCLFKYIENFISKNWKFSDKKLRYFSYFCSKHRLWVLFRTASPRQF